MKKFSKILVAILAAALLLGALAVAVSADDFEEIDGVFVVSGAGYDDWTEAVKAAGGKKVIYLNEDLTLESAIEVAGSTTVRLNLNGRTITQGQSNIGDLFTVSKGATLVLEGSGTFNDVSVLATVSGENSNLVIDGRASGFVVSHRAVADKTTVVNTVRCYNDAGLTVKGALTINTVNGKRCGFDMTKSDTLPGASSLVFENAKVYLPAPVSQSKSETEGDMVRILGNIEVSISNSTLEMVTGTIINTTVDVGYKTTCIDVTAYKSTAAPYKWNDKKAQQEIEFPDPDITINATGSRFVSTAAAANNKVSLFNFDYAKLRGTFDDCVFIGEARCIVVGSNAKVTKAYVNPSQLIFTDCHLKHSGGLEGGFVFFNGANFQWIGGSLHYPVTVGVTGSKAFCLSGGANYYLPLDKGGFVGGYMENVFIGGNLAKYGGTVAKTDYTYKVDSATGAYLPSSGKVANSNGTQEITAAGGTRYTESVTLVIDGEALTYDAAYFSSEELYNEAKKGDEVKEPGRSSVAWVDGVEYTTEEDAIAAIKEGSVVELLKDFKSVIYINDVSFAVKTNGCAVGGFASATHKALDYTGAAGFCYIVPVTADDEIYNVNYLNEEFGIDKTISLVEGSVIPLTDDVAPESARSDGWYYKLADWSVRGKTVVNGAVADASEVVVLTSSEPVQYARYHYTITSGAETDYVIDEGGAMLDINLNEAIGAGADVTLVLWDNVTASYVYELASDTKLDFDLHGYTYTAQNSSASPVFTALPGSSFSLYSSSLGGAFLASDSVILASFYDDTNAKPVNVSFGAAEGVSGDNLTVKAAALAFYLGVDDVTKLSAGVYGANMSVTLNGGVYENEASNAGAFIGAGAPVAISVSGISYDGAASLVMTSPVHYGAAAAVTVDSSSLVSSAESLIGALSANSNVTITNSFINSSLKKLGEGTITLGEKVELTSEVSGLAENGISVAEGCEAAYADYENVLCYIDKPENLAIIRWYNSDNETVIGTTYNAPYGKIVEVYGGDDVANVAATAWYDTKFDNWDIAEDMELSAGQYSVYPVCETRVPSVKCLKVNLTAYTYFKLNFYLPSNVSGEGLEGFELYGIYREYTPAEGEDLTNNPSYMLVGGTWYQLLENGSAELEGEVYKMYNELPGASDASEKSYSIIFAVGEGESREVLVDGFTYGVPTYAETVMEDEDFSDEDKSLIINMVRYANECYKLVNGTDAEKYKALLDAHGDKLMNFESIEFTAEELNVDTSKLADYMSGASFVFGSYQPKFFFKYNDTAMSSLVLPNTKDGEITVWPEGNRGVFTNIYHENYDGTASRNYLAPHLAYGANGAYVAPDLEAGVWNGADAVYATTVDMYVCDITEVINLAVYKPDGTVVRGSYSLAAYITHLGEAISDANTSAEQKAEYESFWNASMSLYAFSLAAQQYDYSVVNK